MKWQCVTSKVISSYLADLTLRTAVGQVVVQREQGGWWDVWIWIKCKLNVRYSMTNITFLNDPKESNLDVSREKQSSGLGVVQHVEEVGECCVTVHLCYVHQKALFPIKPAGPNHLNHTESWERKVNYWRHIHSKISCGGRGEAWQLQGFLARHEKCVFFTQSRIEYMKLYTKTRKSWRNEIFRKRT